MERFTKEDRLRVFREWCASHGYSYEHHGFLDSGLTSYGVIETKRGGRYWVRASTKTFGEHDTVVVKSKSSVDRSGPNSIQILLNNQVVKGKIIGRYNLKEKYQKVHGKVKVPKEITYV